MALNAHRALVLVVALGAAACSSGPDPSALVPAAPPPTARGIPTGAPGAIGWGVDLPAVATASPAKPKVMPVPPPSPMKPPIGGPTKHGSPGGTAL